MVNNSPFWRTGYQKTIGAVSLGEVNKTYYFGGNIFSIKMATIDEFAAQRLEFVNDCLEVGQIPFQVLEFFQKRDDGILVLANVGRGQKRSFLLDPRLSFVRLRKELKEKETYKKRLLLSCVL